MSVTDTVSSRVPAAKRQRTYHIKVRTGCDTCKKRRIRCDETKPRCLRCQRSNLECAGYNPPKANVFEPQLSKPKSTQSGTKAQSEQSPRTNSECEDIVASENDISLSQKVTQTTADRSSESNRSEAESEISLSASSADHIVTKQYQATVLSSRSSNQIFENPFVASNVYPTRESNISEIESQTQKTNLCDCDFQDNICPHDPSTLWDIAVFPPKGPNLRRAYANWGKLIHRTPKNCAGDPTAIHAYGFFHENTKGFLRSFCTASEQLYATLSPQLAFSEPAVKFQLITIGLSHELASTQPKNRQHLQLKLMEYYNLALSSLIKTRSIDPAVLLLCSLLFTTLEIVRGHPRETITHIKSSIQIMIQQMTSASNTKSRTFSSRNLENQIERLNARLAATASLYPSWAVIHEVPKLKWVMPIVPLGYNTFQQALEAFYDLLQWTNFGPFTDLRSHSSMCTLWMQWRERLHDLITKLKSGPRRTHLQSRLVDTYWEMYQASAECQGGDEMLWDKFVEQHRQQLDTCAEVCLSEETYQPAVGRREEFDVVPGVQGPLWVIATACRDPLLRRRALDFLRIHQTRCGRTDSNPAAVVGEFVINMEEAGLGKVRKASDVPVENRVRIMYADYSGLETVKVFYSRWPFTEMELAFLPMSSLDNGQISVGNLDTLNSIVDTTHKLWKGNVRDASRTGYYQGLMRYIRFDLNPLVCNEHAHLYH